MPGTEFSVIGRPLSRIDGAEKVAGLTRYAGDVRLPGMLHARLVVSPFAHARIVRIDGTAGAALPGVVGVFGGRDLPLSHPDPSDRNRAPLALDRALFNGHPVVAVVAVSEAVAEDAAGLVRVEYEELPAAVDPFEAMRPDAPVVCNPGRDEGGEQELAMHGAEQPTQELREPAAPNVASTLHFSRGEIARGLHEADLVVERRYHTSMVHQGYLEPQTAVASVDALGHVTVWTSTQAMFFARSEIAKALGLSEQRVRVIAMPLGGGFGGKFVLLEPLVAALAMAVRRPVSVVMTRMEEFLAANPAPQSIFEVKTGVRRDGRLTALEARIIFDTGAYAGAPVGIAGLLLGGYYRFPHLDIRGYEVLTHKPGCGAYRAPGAVQATFAIESQMDEIARGLGMDPLRLRLLNAAQEGDPMPNGRPWPQIGLRACLEQLEARRADSAEKTRTAPDQGVRRGMGVAVGGWIGGVEPASAVCRLNADGTMQVIVGTVDMSGTNTALAQIAAEAFGVPVERVQVTNTDTDAAPYAGASGGSKVTYTVGTAVQRAADSARRQLFTIAAARLEAAVEDLELADGRVRVRGVPDRAVTLSEVAELSMQFGGKYEPVFGRGASATVTRAPGFAAHLAEVEVKAETGQAHVVNHVVVQDVGRALNPPAVEGQIHGAVAQGVGWALLERMAYDGHGRLLSATLLDYALPAADQVPPVEAVLVEIPSASGPFGAKGVGEPPVIAAAAAIANALTDATGYRFTKLPVTSEAIARARADKR